MTDHSLGRPQPVNLVRRGKALFSGGCESHPTTVGPLAAAKADREATTRLRGPVAASDQRAQCFSRTGYMRKMRTCAVSHVRLRPVLEKSGIVDVWVLMRGAT